jgi:hypothetical protein
VANPHGVSVWSGTTLPSHVECKPGLKLGITLCCPGVAGPKVLSMRSVRFALFVSVALTAHNSDAVQDAIDAFICSELGGAA